MKHLIDEVISAYNWLDRGFLPAPGTWLDQTDAFVEYMEVVSEAISFVSKQRMKTTD